MVQEYEVSEKQNKPMNIQLTHLATENTGAQSTE